MTLRMPIDDSALPPSLGTAPNDALASLLNDVHGARHLIELPIPADQLLEGLKPGRIVLLGAVRLTLLSISNGFATVKYAGPYGARLQVPVSVLREQTGEEADADALVKFWPVL